jgi:hypothetical protein
LSTLPVSAAGQIASKNVAIPTCHATHARTHTHTHTHTHYISMYRKV